MTNRSLCAHQAPHSANTSELDASIWHLGDVISKFLTSEKSEDLATVDSYSYMATEVEGL